MTQDVSTSTTGCHLRTSSSLTTNTCESYSSPLRYCASNNASCASVLPSATLGERLPTDNNQYTRSCVANNVGLSSFAISSFCLGIASMTCSTVPSTSVCSSLATKSSNKCELKENKNLKINEQCGESSLEPCGDNLVCNTKRVCETKRALGAECGSIFEDCTSGSICQLGRCIAHYSLQDGSACTTSLACKSGYCDTTTNKCGNMLVNQKCYRNFECSDHARHSVCMGSSESDRSPGKCTTSYYSHHSEYAQCLAEKCRVGYGEVDYDMNCAAKKCPTQFAKVKCAQHCYKRQDLRYDLSTEYSFNCESFTVTPWSSLPAEEQCSVREQFSNCDSGSDLLFFSGASAKSYVSFVLSISAIIFTLLSLY